MAGIAAVIIIGAFYVKVIKKKKNIGKDEEGENDDEEDDDEQYEKEGTNGEEYFGIDDGNGRYDYLPEDGEGQETETEGE